MKRLIATIDVPWPIDKAPQWLVDMNLGQYTIPGMYRYAQHCRADLRVIRQFDPRGVYPDKEAHWALLDLIRWFAEQEHYEQLLYLDLDIMVMPLSWFKCEPSVFDMLDEEDGLYAEFDMGIPFKALNFAKWCRDELGYEPTHWPIDDIMEATKDDIKIRYFNSGVLMMDRNTAKTLCESMESLPFVTNPGLAEQGYMNALADHAGTFFKPMSSLEDPQYNWVSVEWPNAWVQKKFLHMVGGWKVMAPKIKAFCDAQEKVLMDEYKMHE